MSEQIVSRVHVLIEQGRHKEAEVLIKDLLNQDAADTYLLSLLAEVSLQLDKNEAAKRAVDRAIALEPNSSGLFYLKSRVCLAYNDYRGAEYYAGQAINLDPLDAANFALLAAIQLARKQFDSALYSADKALELDPENLLALNTRSNALIKLKRPQESFQTIEGALRHDPSSFYTHANYGWSLLENGDYKSARKHFKEALYNNPNYEYAQSGMSEAIKAGNPIYRLFLKYAFFMQNLTSRNQWSVIIGFFIITRALRAVAQNNEMLKPYLLPVVLLLSLVAFSTWIIEPVGNLYLSLDPYGKYLLSKQEKLSSKFVAACFALFVAGLTFFAITGLEKYLLVAAFGFLMMLPVSHIFTPAKFKHTFLIYNVIMCAAGLGAIAITFAGGALFNMFTTLFALGFFTFQLAANYFIIKRGNV
jgi:tetratricopeptide (TPR) repeat protein